MRDILVITGDHDAPDLSKPGGRFGAEDLAAHARMVEAMMQIADARIEIWNRHDRLFERLCERARPDLVVNFCDTGFRNEAAREMTVPIFCETLDLAYTGAPPSTLAICYDKQLVRLVAESLGVKTPLEAWIPKADEAALPGFYPALLKPNRADGSLGITKDAVVQSLAEARDYLGFLREEFQSPDVLYQEYLPGPEYGIGLVGNPGDGLVSFPPLVVDFSKLPEGSAPILSYESKSLPDSQYWTDIEFHQAEAPPLTLDTMTTGACRLFERLDLRDYGRFDFRCDDAGVPKLLEVNPNPAWGWDGKLAIMAGFAGHSYAQMLEAITDAAFRRRAHQTH